MSQAKVDKYKESKKNRQKEIKKQKMLHRIEMTVCGIVGVAVIGWIGYSFYGVVTRTDSTEVVQNEIDTAALDDYVNSLTAVEQ